MDAAVRTQQLQRAEHEAADSDKDSECSMESVSSDRGSHKPGYKTDESDKKTKSNKRKSKSRSMKSKLLQERIAQYREGKQNLPSHEVIQNSLHVKTNKVDLQLCDDMSGADVMDSVQGSMLIQVSIFTALCDRHGYYGAAGIPFGGGRVFGPACRSREGTLE